MLTLNAALAQGLKNTLVQPVVYLAIVANTRADESVTSTFKCVHSAAPYCENSAEAEADQVWVPNLLKSIASASYEIDPKDRSSSIGQFSFDLIDTGAGSPVRAWLDSVYINGAQVTVKLGLPGMALSTFAPLGVYYAVDAIPEPGSQAIQCRDSKWIIEEQSFAGLWVAEHPAEIALRNLRWCGVPDALINTTSFAFNSLAARSHYNMRREGVRIRGGVGRPVTKAEGDFAESAGYFRSWQIDGANRLTTNTDGKVFAELEVRAQNDGTYAATWYILNFYTSASGGAENWCGFGKCVQGISSPGGWLTGTIGGVVTQPGVDDDPFATYFDGLIDDNKRLTGGSFEINTDAFEIDDTLALHADNFLVPDGLVLGKDTSIKSLLDDICFLAGATIHDREDGKLEWKYFVPGNTPVRTLTGDDITTLTIVDREAGIVNRVKATVKYTHYDKKDQSSEDKALVLDRVDSQAQHSYDGGTTSRILPEDIDIDLTDASAILLESIESTETGFDIGYNNSDPLIYGAWVENCGMCCTVSAASGREAASASGRYLWLLIDSAGHREFVKVGATVFNGRSDATDAVDPQDGSIRTIYNQIILSCSSVSRGQLGTTAAHHTYGVRVYDVTLAVETAQRILDRQEDGLPSLDIELGLEHVDLQCGDFIYVEHDLAAAAGVYNDDALEITSKEIDPLGSPPCVRIKCSRVGAPTATTDTGNFSDRWGSRDRNVRKNFDLDYFEMDGGVAFVDGRGLRTDLAGLFWDKTNGRLGIGTQSPDVGFEVAGGVGRFGASVAIDIDATTSTPWLGTSTNHPLSFKSNATEYMRLTTAGKLGIGRTDPQALLHIQASATGLSSYSGNALAVFERNDHANISIVTPDDRGGSVVFEDEDGDFGATEYDHATDIMNTYVKNAILMTLGPEGGLSLKDTGSTPGTPAADWIVMWVDGAAVKFKDSGGKTATITLT